MSDLLFVRYDFLLSATCMRCYHPNYLSIDTLTKTVTCAKCKNIIQHSETLKSYTVALQKAHLNALPKESRVPFCASCYTEFPASALQQEGMAAIKCANCQTATPIVKPNTLLKTIFPRMAFSIGKSPQPLPVLLRKEHQLKCTHCETVLETELNGTEVVCQSCHKSQFISVELAMQIGGTKAFMPQPVFFAFDFSESPPTEVPSISLPYSQKYVLKNTNLVHFIHILIANKEKWEDSIQTTTSTILVTDNRPKKIDLARLRYSLETKSDTTAVIEWEIKTTHFIIVIEIHLKLAHTVKIMYQIQTLTANADTNGIRIEVEKWILKLKKAVQELPIVDIPQVAEDIKLPTASSVSMPPPKSNTNPKSNPKQEQIQKSWNEQKKIVLKNMDIPHFIAELQPRIDVFLNETNTQITLLDIDDHIQNNEPVTTLQSLNFLEEENDTATIVINTENTNKIAKFIIEIKKKQTIAINYTLQMAKATATEYNIFTKQTEDFIAQMRLPKPQKTNLQFVGSFPLDVYVKQPNPDFIPQLQALLKAIKPFFNTEFVVDSAQRISIVPNNPALLDNEASKIVEHIQYFIHCELSITDVPFTKNVRLYVQNAQDYFILYMSVSMEEGSEADYDKIVEYFKRFKKKMGGASSEKEYIELQKKKALKPTQVKSVFAKLRKLFE